jgi:quinol monooxygenase YgiN
MIISLLKLKPISWNRPIILDILRFAEEKVSLKRGCLGCGIYEQCNEGRTILYLEQWQSKKEMHRHIQSKLYLRILNAMDLCREEPDICLYEVLDTKHLEMVKALRLKNDLV